MSISETIPNFLENETPLLTNPLNFSQYTDNYHLKIQSVISSINIWGIEANNLVSDVNNKHNAILGYVSSINSSRESAQTSATNAAQSATNASVTLQQTQDYLGTIVVPAEATYNLAAIDKMNDDRDIESFINFNI